MTQFIRQTVAVSVVLIGPAVNGAGADPPARPAGDDLLDQLVGRWDLTGSLGNKPLAQSVSAEWVLNHRFLQIVFRDRNPPRGNAVHYEAVHYVGRESSGGYVMHLLDVFGPEYSKTLGVGTRDGDAITFTFDYPGDPFRARYALDRARKTWAVTITHKDKSGDWKLFAEKRLVRPAGKGD
jgi:hypothetical protein